VFCMMASFNFNRETFPSLADAERHYLEYHVPLARRLPGLRRYVIGRAVDFGPFAADRYRGALLAFDDATALRAAYASEVGRELRVDEKRLIADAVVTFIDAQDIVGGKEAPCSSSSP
jgi:uncharacterized protein (TIGR02118 family)